TLQRLRSLSSSTQTTPAPVATSTGWKPTEIVFTTRTSRFARTSPRAPSVQIAPSPTVTHRYPELRWFERPSVEGSIRVRVRSALATKTAPNPVAIESGPAVVHLWVTSYELGSIWSTD